MSKYFISLILMIAIVTQVNGQTSKIGLLTTFETDAGIPTSLKEKSFFNWCNTITTFTQAKQTIFNSHLQSILSELKLNKDESGWQQFKTQLNNGEPNTIKIFKEYFSKHMSEFAVLLNDKLRSFDVTVLIKYSSDPQSFTLTLVNPKRITYEINKFQLTPLSIIRREEGALINGNGELLIPVSNDVFISQSFIMEYKNKLELKADINNKVFKYSIIP